MKRVLIALAVGCLLTVPAHTFDVKKVFFKAPANVVCQQSANSNFNVRVTHEGCLMQSDVDAGSIDVDVVDSDVFSDDELDGTTHNLPGSAAAGDRYRFTTMHDLWCTPKDDCEVRGASGGSGESEVELRTEYGDDSDNHGCATVLCTCGEAPAGHLAFVATLETAPGQVQSHAGGTVSYGMRVQPGGDGLPRGAFIRSTFHDRETGIAIELENLGDFVLPPVDDGDIGAMCADVVMPLDLPLGTYVLTNELIDVTGRLIEEDFVEVRIVTPPSRPDGTKLQPGGAR